MCQLSSLQVGSRKPHILYSLTVNNLIAPCLNPSVHYNIKTYVMLHSKELEMGVYNAIKSGI